LKNPTKDLILHSNKHYYHSISKMNKITLALVSTVFAITSFAQNGINTPYSRYGFGIQSERAMGFNKGMGGVAQGFRNGKEINTANPASFSSVDSLTALFDLGISLQNSNHKMGSLQQNVRNSSFDYFAFQFRAFRRVGMTLGIMPITNIKYSFASSEEKLQGTENVTSSYSFSGDGGLREVFFGTGWQIFRPISIGFNARYIWGDYTHNAKMSLSESSAFNLSRIYTGEVSAFSWQAGLQYIQPLNSKDRIVIGATYTYGNKAGGDATRTTQTLNSTTVEEATIDTIKNAFQLPHAIAAGFTYYHSNKLRIGADFELEKWSDVRFPNNQTGMSSSAISGVYTSTKGQLNDRTKIAVGLDYTPDSESFKLTKRMTYKVGGYYSKSYAQADPTGRVTDKPTEFGVSAGVTIPIRNTHNWRGVPKLNFAVQWTHTNIPYFNSTTLRQSTLSENYLRFCVGLTFNERWFQKWKAQ